MSRIAVAQMISTANVDDNLNQLPTFFGAAQKKAAKLLVLPENFACMGLKETDKLAIAEQEGRGKIQNRLISLAKEYKLWVIAGTMPLLCHNQKRVRASSLVYNAEGEQVACYDKIHLFDVRISQHEAHQESLSIAPGSELVVVDTPVGKIGLSVCYDLRFPELYRQLTKRGAEIFSIPSAFTAVTGKAHWDILIKARAIENMCFVAAANQGGVHDNGRKTYGHSMIVEPWGGTLTELSTGQGIEVADINLQRLQELRSQFPCNEHHVL